MCEDISLVLFHSRLGYMHCKAPKAMRYSWKGLEKSDLPWIWQAAVRLEKKANTDTQQSLSLLSEAELPPHSLKISF